MTTVRGAHLDRQPSQRLSALLREDGRPAARQTHQCRSGCELRSRCHSERAKQRAAAQQALHGTACGTTCGSGRRQDPAASSRPLHHGARHAAADGSEGCLKEVFGLVLAQLVSQKQGVCQLRRRLCIHALDVPASSPPAAACEPFSGRTYLSIMRQ